VDSIRKWATDLGFDQLGISGINLGEHEQHLLDWLAAGYHGDMEYMQRHGTKRSRPAELEPGTLRVISVRMDYLPKDPVSIADIEAHPGRAYVARYALGRDYHKVMRKRLQKLADRIAHVSEDIGYRAFVDSAPVLEKALANNAGLGWIGKHTNLINEHAGSWFFLGELYTNLPLPVDKTSTAHCGTCTACIDVCPTQAIVAPYQLDARRCISYLTIELRNSIPVELRPLIGNRIFGCDDCQLVCPWNRFAEPSRIEDFLPRKEFLDGDMLTLFGWDEETFLHKTQGSPLRRIGHTCWLRNLAVAMGNAPFNQAFIDALTSRRDHPDAMLREHISWAIAQQTQKKL
jgi:epoxyqueuosine reductase